MKLLFVSGVYPIGAEKTLQKNCKSANGLQNAPNSFQWAVIDGLMKNDIVFNVVSFPWLPTYPFRYKKFYTPSLKLEKDGICLGSVERYCTMMVLKELSIKYRLRNYVDKWIRHNLQEDQLIVMFYQPMSYYLEALVPLKKKYPNLRLSTIVTDMVEDVFEFKYNRGILKRLQMKRESKIVKSHYKDIDKFILLTQAMEERIPEAIGRSIVMEGIYAEVHSRSILDVEKKGERSILYTGTLEEYAGIKELIESFMLLPNSNYRLIICGGGTLSPYVQEKANLDSRIIYEGTKERSQVLTLQENATLLINPRKPNNIITRYSFPSKTMEYLASGTPMLGYQLSGIPEEYFDYMYTIEDFSNEAMAKRIDEILSLPQSELVKKAISARLFILNYKNSKRQMAKVLTFLQK